MTTTIALLPSTASPLNKRALAYARTLTGDECIFVLSRALGLLKLTDEAGVADLEIPFALMSPQEQHDWARGVNSKLEMYAQQEWGQPLEFVLLTPPEYFTPLEHYLHRMGVVSQPLTGLTAKEQLEWLTQRVG